MQATTSGETHNKNNVYLGKDVKDFITNQKASFSKLANLNCLYTNKVILNSSSLNYINLLPENKVDTGLKNLILKEYKECERIYPYLGDYFIERFFDITKLQKRQSFIFTKKEENRFISSLEYDDNKAISKWIFSNINLERNVIIKDHEHEDIIFEFMNDFSFELDYDYDFYVLLNNPILKNFRFVIVDGYIESIGEIHHVLTKSNETKESYVIFCYGMGHDVKKTLIKNNIEGRTKVFPISLNTNNESSLNIFNDIATVLKGSIISSQLGQTISQEMRKDLPVGKMIQFYKNKIILSPIANKKEIKSHREFLKTRIEDAIKKGNVNIEPLENRLKMFSSKRVNLYLPRRLSRNKELSRELDYFFKFISTLNLSLKRVLINSKKGVYYIPKQYLDIAEGKVKSLQSIFNDIKAIIA
jgi:predicted DNA-binding protein YlxM (UPF0122 family)